MNKKFIPFLGLLSLVLFGAGCVASKQVEKVNNVNQLILPINKQQVGIANPASVNCEEKGGFLKIETRGDGGQFGVCYFDDNRQCEEWAMLHNKCPVGGLKVTGYVTEAARYCVITGGEYRVTDETVIPEQGTCKLPNGNVCDVWDFYNGKCS